MKNRDRFALIGRPAAGLVAGICFGFILGFLTVNAAWPRAAMFASDGILTVVALGCAIRWTRLRGFGFIAGVAAGIAISIIVLWVLLAWVVTGL